MLHAQGSFRWLAADAATTTYTQTCTDTGGAGTFQPLAIRFWWMGLGAGADSASQTVHQRVGGSFALTTSNRLCVGAQSQDAVGAQVCTTGYRNDCIAMSLTSTPAADGLLDLDALLSTGFRCIVDDQGVTDLTICWEAWGGTDLIVAVIGEISEPAAVGAQSVAVTGFTADAGDQVVLFFGVQGAAAPNTVTRNDAALMVGFASAPTTAENVVGWMNDDDASTTSDTDRYAVRGECVSLATVGGGDPSSRALVNKWNAGAFNLEWIARATTGRRYIFLALKGGRWNAGGLVIDGATGSAVRTIAGLPFTPLGVLLFGTMGTQQVPGTSATEGRLALGAGSSTSARRTQGSWSENGNGTAAEVDTIEEFDQVLAYPTNAGGVTAAKDISQMNAGGFQLIVDATGGVADEFIGFLTFGTAPSSPATEGILAIPSSNPRGTASPPAQGWA